ncbi:MAG: hypothetical protein APR53_10245 [Methanoculleus sp. SDB]|nr:MAG: hypothetical protein APR53_10245 [Methanoculleus sp. SDB]
MKQIDQMSGVPGMLRPFKKFIMEAGLGSGDQIVYYGCPGTCTPFIELLAFAIRDLPVQQVYVPYFEESNAKQLALREGVGMQVTEGAVSLSPAVIVVMGGLSMPGVPVTVEKASETVAQYSARKIGVCFMDMFQKTGWLDSIAFDLLIDATIDPVRIYSGQD